MLSLFSPFTPKLLPCAQNRAVKPEPGIKDEFEQVKREFPFGTFRAGNKGPLTFTKGFQEIPARK